eukprot:TRINITY_DN32343_c0_g1_i1.p1 TRINITY_DN32343_c0_g1~~TRINITY_DN32343_c0_g1_i1.p1  ORF type:complete len:483 (+),score=85.23 TRINITY_DN32343_c0_g1_i1:180-1451(+)
MAHAHVLAAEAVCGFTQVQNAAHKRGLRSQKASHDAAAGKLSSVAPSRFLGLSARKSAIALFFADNTKRSVSKGRAFVTHASLAATPGSGSEDEVPIVSEAVELTEPKAVGFFESDLGKTVFLGGLFGAWYYFNIIFNVYNKQVLNAFPYPVTMTQLQFGAGTLVAFFFWATGILSRPKLSADQILAILPLAGVHMLGNLFTNMSLGKVAVSFTHTIKALEPFFSVMLSALVLGEAPTLPVVASLMPIVAGVALASATEASFNWAGFLSAMASNLTFQSRNVLSKKFMVKKDGGLDNINLFSVITVLAFLLLLPVTLLTEGVKFTPAVLASRGLDVNLVMKRALFAGLCFHAYQQVSYMILQRVSPITHSVGNCVKRVIVIVTSVIFFRTKVSVINGIGTGVALLGVFAYSRVKAAKGAPKKE